MSKGFLVLAQNTEFVDYIKQAYALALSIKGTQKTVNKISLITNDNVPDEYKHVFDNIIEIPWGDLAKNPQWKVENRWKLYHASPYDETIVLDTDMLMIDDISSWWDYCSNSDLKFCSQIKNYKAEVIHADLKHRKTFINNKLPNPYVALHYFKKSELAHDFYKVLEFVVKNWEMCYKLYAPLTPQSWLSMDLAIAISIAIMGLEETVIDSASPLEFVHMKPGVQNWSPVPSSWQHIVPFNFNDGKIMIGNHRQHYILHYVEKDFLNESMIKKIEAVYG